MMSLNYSLLNRRERIETLPRYKKTPQQGNYSLLNRRERIETIEQLHDLGFRRITPSLTGGRGLKLPRIRKKTERVELLPP